MENPFVLFHSLLFHNSSPATHSRPVIYVLIQVPVTSSVVQQTEYISNEIETNYHSNKDTRERENEDWNVDELIIA